MPETPCISVEARPDVVLVRALSGDLGETEVVRFRNELAEAAGKSPAMPFIVDLATVKFVPSLALGVLVRLVNEFRARRQRLVFVSLQAPVRQVLAITRLDRVMEIADDVNAALRSVGAVA
jgi:anti-anti-sigma factor